ncbi:phage tail length tape measure family protein [Stutzerimonas stutzeri]|uniref:phage tail length tape measure family protein n=1 Tax=Stutzerimonas stutzeri TaxID=316 RepID=UPI001C74B4B7|nr:phage tail length tape measure family protein [Stutzerimonas stutzeri]BCY01591.1 hypothetical protein PszF2a_13800 [Stutzerimonas stutzeri]
MAFERLIQLTLRARNFLSKDVAPASESMKELAEDGRRLKDTLEEVGRARGLARTLRDNQQATEGLERAQRDAAATLDDLTREIGDQERATAGQRIALREARRTLDEAERAYKRNQQAIKNTTSELKKLGVDTDNVTAEEARLTAELETGKKALADNREAIKQKRVEEKKAAEATKEHTDRVEAARSALSDGAKRVLAFAAAYISLNAAFNLVRGGLNLVRDGIRAVIADGSEIEQALAQLEAALASTGNAAGLTAQQLLDMAAGFKRSSMLTTEQILAGQTRLLSYTDIVASEFPAAMQIVIDQQQRLGISVEQSAEIVGRALQSPSEAIATLGRQGFKLEDGQKRLLKQLEATGRKAEAQAIIMDMLTEAYGGAAAAARMNTFAGLLKTVGDQFGDFAGRVADSGAFEYVRGKLQQLADHLDEMANDGRLDRLAQSLSDAFVNGAEAVSKYVEKLATVDFEGLAARAASMAAQIGPAIEQTVTAGRYATATLTTVWNTFAGVVSSAAAQLTLVVQQTVGRLALIVGEVADVFGGSEFRAKASGLYEFLGDLSAAYAEQAKTDFGQIGGAWDFLTEKVQQKATEQAQVVKQAADDQFEHVVQRVTDMNNALAQIDAAEGAGQFRQLGDELFAAYQRGDLSQQQFASTTAIVQRRLRELGGTANAATDELDNLKSIMGGISRAANEVDFNRLRSALRKAYGDGVITAEEFAKAQDALNQRIAEVKPATDKAVKGLADQRQAMSEASEAARRSLGGVGDAAQEAASGMNFFDEVLSRSRTPLAELSAAALDAFDALQGIKKADAGIDTSSLEKTSESLQKAKDRALELQGALDLEGSRATGFGRWMMETFVRSEQVKVSYLEQKRALQSLMQSYESGSMSTEAFARSAASARRNLDLLDESDLSGLESAIEAANQKMRQMGESTRGTLESLQMELLQLKGTEEEIEKARFASRRRDLQAQQAEARQSGDGSAVANLQAALRTLNEIERESSRKRTQDAQQKAAEQVTKAAPVPVQPQQPPKIIRLETTRGQSVEVGLQSETDETRLLGILEGAGLRSRR